MAIITAPRLGCFVTTFLAMTFETICHREARRIVAIQFHVHAVITSAAGRSDPAQTLDWVASRQTARNDGACNREAEGPRLFQAIKHSASAFVLTLAAARAKMRRIPAHTPRGRHEQASR